MAALLTAPCEKDMAAMSGKFFASSFLGIVLALTACLLAAPVQATSVIGVWATEEEKSHVEIRICEDDEDKLCGTIVWLREPLNENGEPKTDRNNPEETLQDRRIIGLRLMTDFEKTDDPDVWEEGKIYNPEDGETYSCVITLLAGDLLEVRGYVGLPLLGKSQEWRRVR
jgi:uncharacterized protein (DUF2147 family)